MYMPDQTFVVVQNLTKTYPAATVPVLQKVSFEVHQGEICSIIGRSGAGKSTLLRCLNALESFDSGSIQIGAAHLDQASEKERRAILKEIGTVFQTFNLLSRRTVLENILLPAEWSGIPKDKAIKKAVFLSEKVGLGDKMSAYPSSLSGGQRQRIAIARALITDTKLLLCDEFTSALDPETSLEILSLLRQLNRELGVTVVLVTHDMSVVREVSDHVIVMEKGEIVEKGKVEEILLQPRHEVTHTLVRGLFIKQLPNDILKRLVPGSFPGHVLIQLVFSGSSARQPVIANLIRQYDVPVTILAGSLDHLKETSLGVLTISIPNELAKVAQTLDHFKVHQVAAEILGYLPESIC
ncbi:methionine ABC transporter ATP-binding protein [Candidatus Paracaedibacter symbiosus]|uniref:methionine ABC transporter ATP-binding protein n=1 Tax=Candidatus Paracaedibacter symbiosus TaxID=244582 RepID=UPI000A019CF5|nr:methionine ABC transporter ATP-binding protein [Candidatus Paracaedibacter symbiosus]